MPRGDAVLELDPATLSLRKRVRVGDGPGALAADDGVVWVANLDDRTLIRIDTRSPEVSGAPIALGKEIEGLVLTPKGLWSPRPTPP
jgi:DNA-binding beta-propeller fold protein YncE